MTAELLVKLTIINCRFSSLRLRFVTAELLVKLKRQLTVVLVHFGFAL